MIISASVKCYKCYKLPWSNPQISTLNLLFYFKFISFLLHDYSICEIHFCSFAVFISSRLAEADLTVGTFSSVPTNQGSGVYFCHSGNVEDLICSSYRKWRFIKMSDMLVSFP